MPCRGSIVSIPYSVRRLLAFLLCPKEGSERQKEEVSEGGERRGEVGLLTENFLFSYFILSS
jgi:hypothetical protein